MNQDFLYDKNAMKILQDLTDPFLDDNEVNILIDRLVKLDILLAKKIALMSWKEMLRFQKQLGQSIS